MSEERRRACHEAPAAAPGKPDDTPGSRPETPPRQEGEQPGTRPERSPGQEDHPDKPEKPEEGQAGDPTQARGASDDVRDPDHPSPAPGHAPQPQPHATPAPPVEALLGIRDFLALAPRRARAASTVAAQAALERWMRLHGHDTNGFYAMEEWMGFYTETLAYTGTGAPG